MINPAINRRESLKLMLGASAGVLVSPYLAQGQLSPTSSSLPAVGAKPSAQRDSTESKVGLAPTFTWLTLGEVKPSGWIKEQMVRDLNQGFAGRLDELCHEASSDIFVSHRNSRVSANQDHVANDTRYWWNGETEGNWRAGFIMMAYLTEDEQAMLKADDYVRHILSSQGEDGYLGAFAPDIRFSKPGDLWTQTCLLRGLLDYAELSGNRQAMEAVVRAASLSISVYGAGKTSLISGIGGQGESHDLMISDVMERLFDLTGDVKYRDFVVDLYRELSVTAKDADTTLYSLINRDSGWVDHGVNTYETIRVPLWLWMATGRQDFGDAARNALDKLDRYTEPSGSAVSEEEIKNLKPDPMFTEYEYCATKEIQFTLESALQKTGVPTLGDKIERIWFNAAQGSRLPDGRAITYLTADNRLHCDGTSPDGMKADTANKFSPTQADVAVCCNPNAANVAPLYVRGMWMRHANGGLAALLYGPSTVSTTIRGVSVHLEERTNYPFENTVEVGVRTERNMEFPLLLRNPAWSNGTTVKCNGATIIREGAYWMVTKEWRSGDTVRIVFSPDVLEVPAVNGEVALQYGALLFVQAIEARKTTTKTYPVSGFEDAYYFPVPGKYEALALPARQRWCSFGFKPAHLTDGTDMLHPFDRPVLVLRGSMVRRSDGADVPISLIPMGNAPTLRRTTFPIMS
jgi:uncharacterized protein